MDTFFDVDFFRNKCTVLVKHFHILYLCSGAIFNSNHVRLKLRCFLIVYFCFGYLYCSIPPIKGLLLDNKLEHTFDGIGFLMLIHYNVSNIYLFYSNRNEFHRLFDLITEHSKEPIITIDTDDLNLPEDYFLRETNILKVCFRIYRGLVSWYIVLYVGKICKALFSSGTTIQINDESEFLIPFLCTDCNTPTSYILVFSLAYFSVIPFIVFQTITLCLFVVLSICLKNRAIRLRNEIRFYSDAAYEKFENYDQLEEQELKRRHPSTFQLREIDQLRKRQVREYMSKVHQWIRIHQRIIGCIKQYQKCAKKIVDLMTGFIFICVTFMGYYFARRILDGGNYAYHLFGCLVIYLLMMLECCNLGNDVGDVSEIISHAVYSTPWIYLPAIEQKVILNFLTLSQPTQTITIFGVISLCLELVPANLNDAYGYIQLMRLLDMRRKNRNPFAP